MQDTSLQSIFAGRHGFFLVSSGEYAEPPLIENVQAGIPETYPAGWIGLSATSAENLAEIKISQGETDWTKFDQLDNLCVRRQYIALSVYQVSMTRETFSRTFGEGAWDSRLGAWCAEGRYSPSYRSLLVCFFSQGKIMAVYFSRVKMAAGEDLLKFSRNYFSEIPVNIFVQEPVIDKASKYVIYAPKKREKISRES